MIWAILIAVIIVAVIAEGIGVSFFGFIGILLVLAVVAFIGIGLWVGDDDESKGNNASTKEKQEENKKKLKFKSNLGKIILIGTIITVIVIIFSGIFGSCSRLSDDNDKHGAADNEYDEVMEGYDWGDGYYYDSSDNTVKKTLW